MTPLLFHKYHGLGNDYLVCHRSVADRLSPEQIRLLCHPNYGIGSDGLLIDSGDAVNPTLRIITPRRPEGGKRPRAAHLRARSPPTQRAWAANGSRSRPRRGRRGGGRGGEADNRGRWGAPISARRRCRPGSICRRR